MKTTNISFICEDLSRVDEIGSATYAFGGENLNSLADNIVILVLEEKIGGELTGMETLAKAIGAKLLFFFGNDAKLCLKPSTTLQKVLLYLQRKAKFAPIKNMIRHLYPFTFNLNKMEDIYIISSGGCAFPRGGKSIAFVHTPPRVFSDLYTKYKIEMQKKSPMAVLILPFIKLFYNTLYKISIYRTFKILSISETVSNRLDSFYNIKSDVIYQGIELGEFQQGNFEKYFLWLSRIERFKNPMFAISAFSIFYHKRKDFKLVIAGTIEDDVFMEELKSITRDEKLPIEFVTNRNYYEIKHLLSNCYCLLYTSINEDFGRVPLEAMASCKPVISINSGGPTETIVDGVTGYLVESFQEMSEKMERIANDSKEAIMMGHNARKHVEEHFSVERYTDDLINVLEKLIQT